MHNAFWEHKSLFGFDWLRGIHFLPYLRRWAKKASGVIVDVGAARSPISRYFASPRPFT